MRSRPIGRRSIQAAALWLVAALAAEGVAGGGPENVLLVVNATSDASLEVANHYARLRNLPASNVVYLDYEGDRETITSETFRTEILGPVLAAIKVRGLGVQIDTITYACDFPWRVRLREDYPKEAKFRLEHSPTASLTGATYLWQPVLIRSAATLAFDSNWYAGSLGPANLRNCTRLSFTATRAFRGRYAWRANGQPLPRGRGGKRYYLSTMLGVTTGRGNTVAEIVASLRRAALADTSPPKGAFYFVRNDNVRSKARHNCYASAVEALERLGAEAAVAEGVLPESGSVVAGMMLGYAALPLESAGLSIEPGAICEHLTSSGGDLTAAAFQTPLSELIRAGAAGASGTVVEPTALQAKFPAPTLQVHYRRGASLAEAFYQSVSAPFQLLVVGDPLCQPWSRRPSVDVKGWPATRPGLAVRASRLPIVPEVTGDGDRPGLWELYIDGRMSMRAPSGTPYEIGPDQLDAGWHELRCVGIDAGSQQWQRTLTTAVSVPREAAADDEGGEPRPLGQVRLVTDRAVVGFDDRVKLAVEAAGATEVEIRQNSRVVAVHRGPVGAVQLDASRLGRGPVRLQAVARPDGAASAPVWVAIK